MGRKGVLPLDPFSRLRWALFHTSSACLSTGYPHVPLLPYLRQKAINIGKKPLATLTTSLQGGATTLKPTQRIGAMLLISSMLLTGVSVAEEPSNPPAATEALVTAAPTEAPTATPAQEQPTEQSADVPTATPAPENPTEAPTATPAPENPTDEPTATPAPENPTDEPTATPDRKSTRLNSSHGKLSRMPSSA